MSPCCGRWQGLQRHDLARPQGLLRPGAVSGHCMSIPARNFRKCTRSATAMRRNGISTSIDRALPARSRRSIRPCRRRRGRRRARPKASSSRSPSTASTALIAGIRRDEEATRAKERVFSPRGLEGQLGRARPAAGILGPLQRRAAAGRASARSSDPALDRTRHLGLHAARRHSHHPALSRQGRQALSLARRRRHHVPVESQAATIDEIIARTRTTKTPERSGRAMDHETEDAFERLRVAGYL